MFRKFYIKTQGCQMNEYDSSKMADLLKAVCNMESTDDPNQADVLLLNTCSIREKAQEKVFSQLGQWRSLKRQRPKMVIGVGGCVASQEGHALHERAPFVDIIFGPQTLHRLPEMIETVLRKHEFVVDISFPEIEKFDYLPAPRSEGSTAFVSIMEGCSKYCSFCVVPYTRGEEVSRPFDDVIAEIAALAEQNVREVTLLGQNVNAYRGQMYDGGTADIALLIRYVAEIDSIERIRYTTSHPIELSKDLIQAYTEIPKLVSHIHLPVQSGSDRILALMKRGHTIHDYQAKIRDLRMARPGISISSDFIVGFPGETEADFEETLNLIDTIGFDHSFSFIFSPRPGTPAADLADDVPLVIKKERLARLQARLERSAQEISRKKIGTIQRVLVNRPARKNLNQLLSGRTENNHVVNFSGPEQLIGHFANVLITEALPHSLRGRLLADPESSSNCQA